jgi:hypothetical protein
MISSVLTDPCTHRLWRQSKEQRAQEVKEDAKLRHKQVGFSSFVAVGQEFVADGQDGAEEDDLQSSGERDNVGGLL